MAIAFGTANNSGTSTSNPLSWSYTAPGGTNEVLVVGGAIRGSGGQGSVASATYAGGAITSIDTQTETNAFLGVGLFWKATPAAGANTVAITFTVASSIDWTHGGALTLTGAHQSTIDSSAKGSVASGTSITTAITIANANAWIVDICASNSGTLGTAGGTARVRTTAGADDFIGMQTAGPLSTGSNNVSWTGFDAAQRIAQVVGGFQEAAGAAAGQPTMRRWGGVPHVKRSKNAW